MPSFRRWNLEGERRSYRVRLKNADCIRENDSLKLSFDLDSGSYATSVVREILKENFTEPTVTLTSS